VLEHVRGTQILVADGVKRRGQRNQDYDQATQERNLARGWHGRRASEPVAVSPDAQEVEQQQSNHTRHHARGRRVINVIHVSNYPWWGTGYWPNKNMSAVMIEPATASPKPNMPRNSG
jgi:hypothetical protein